MNVFVAHRESYCATPSIGSSVKVTDFFQELIFFQALQWILFMFCVMIDIGLQFYLIPFLSLGATYRPWSQS